MTNKNSKATKEKVASKPIKTALKTAQAPESKATVSKKDTAQAVDGFITLKNLTKHYINSKSEMVTALKGINLTFPSSGFVCLTGESGSGKSTLLNILGALDGYDKGDMVVDGTSFKDFTFKELDDWRANHTAFVFQDFNLLSDFTVGENIRLGCNFAGMDVTDTQIDTVLEKVGLKGFASRSIDQLSGGERQRVSIARALVKTPKILLVDEPTGQINTENAEKVFSILKDISKEALVVCVSYDTNAKKYIDREIQLNKGEVVKDVELTKSKDQAVQIADSGLRNQNKRANFESQKKSRHIMKIGLRNITGRKKWRTIALVFLTTFSLLFGSVFYMLSGYNQYEALAKSAQLESLPFILFESNDNDVDYEDAYIKIYDDYQLHIKHGAHTYTKRVFKSAGDVITGVVEMLPPIPNTVGSYNAFGQKLIYGKYPISNSDGVVITDYLANKAGSTGEDMEYLLGKQLEITATGFKVVGESIPDIDIAGRIKVCGIVETDYKKLDEGSAQYKFNLENFYKNIHVAPNSLELYAGITEANLITINDEDYSGLVDFYNFTSFKSNYHGYSLDKGYIRNETDANGDPIEVEYLLIDKDSKTWTSIADNAIIVSKSIYEAHREHSTDWNMKLTVNGIEKTYSIAAVVIDDLEDKSRPDAIVFADKDFQNDILAKIEFPYTGLLQEITDMSVGKLASIIESFDKEYGLLVKTSSSDEINDFSAKMYIFKTSVLLFTIVSIILTMALFYNFISITILDNKKNIGVLRSLGASGGNIASIFATSVGVIISMCIVVTSILATITASIINAVVLKNMQLPFHVIVFNPALFGVITLLCLAIGVVATIVPIVKYSRQSPISQIKGNRKFKLKKA